MEIQQTSKLQSYYQKNYLPKLKYSFNSLEPFIDAKTLEIHYSKHHQGYIDGLNAAELKLFEMRKSNDFSNIKHVKREIAFNGSGHFLHSLYWSNMCSASDAKGKPYQELLKLIEEKYISYETFLREFKATAMTVEGSGWALLIYSPDNSENSILGKGNINIIPIEKHQEIALLNGTPLLACDVWEHAYYLKYKNNRSVYIDNWFKVIDWEDVEKRLKKAIIGKIVNCNDLIEENIKY